jgi:hypothetical protein
LEDLGDIQPRSTPKQLREALDRYGLEGEEELTKNVPFERLCELITWETPSGAAYSLLSPFESDPRTKGILEFCVSPSIGSGFIGVQLLGSRLEFRRLLRQLKLSDDANLPLECEIYCTKVRTQAAQVALRHIVDTDANDEKIDFIEAVPLIEEYIQSGEPALHKYSAMKYESALEEIPKESQLYRAIATEIHQQLTSPKRDEEKESH